MENVAGNLTHIRGATGTSSYATSLRQVCDYADDLSLLSDSIDKAQSLLHDLETAAALVGLHVNASKTEFMLVNIDDMDPTISSISGSSLKYVQDFKYLGSYIADCKKDFNTRKGQAWDACIKLQKIWNSKISRAAKLRFFKACVEPDLLYPDPKRGPSIKLSKIALMGATRAS